MSNNLGIYQRGGGWIRHPVHSKRIESWGLDTRDVYGISDVFSCLSGECDQKRGMRFMVGDYVIMELVELKSGEAIEPSDGVEAEPVLTTIDRGASPVIRFR